MKKSFFATLSTIALSIVDWTSTHGIYAPSFNIGSQLCLSEFYEHVAPELINEKLKTKSYPLCFDGFTLNYSGVSKTPLWVAEKITPQRLANKIAREDSFHEELRLPVNARAVLDDYRRSGFDRGHMAPNGDMSTKSSQYDSFSLANIIPQTPENNQHTWREVEEATRAMVKKYKQDAYVITGPAFLKSKIKYIKNGHKIMVPTHVYKVIYFPKTGIVSAYMSRNDTSKTVNVISVCALEEQTGINFLPTLSESIKRQVYDLPKTANKVKANKQPKYVKTDLLSQCASTPDSQQIKQTQQLFVKDINYNENSVRSESESSIDVGNDSQTMDIIQILIAVLNYLKTLFGK